LEVLKNKIRSIFPVNDEDLEFTAQFYKKIFVKKGDVLLKPGQYVKHFYFMEKGCVCYYTLFDGVEKVMDFFTENDFFTDLYAYIEDIPSNSFLSATENCVIYSILKEDIQKSFDRSHEYERYGRLLVQDNFIRTYRQLVLARNLSNEDRYLRLLDKRPDLVQRVPQYLIASYLGLTPVGLSKIRKRLSKS